MSRLAISETPTTITVVDQETAKVYTITNTQPNWNKVVDLIKEEDTDEEILQTISVRAAVENFAPSGTIAVVGNDVRYKNHPLHGLDVDHLLEAIRTGNKRQAKALTLFLENKQLNPSYRAVNDMYKFRQDRGMPLTDDGCFLAYKGVGSDYWSKNGNPNTIVLSGETNEQGQILNKIGAYIEVDRKCVEDDPTKGCGEGLHAGSLEYASGWGNKVVIVKINPKDVVSVPTSEDNKMRVCAYTVVNECEGLLPQNFSKELDEDYDTDDSGCECDTDGLGCDCCNELPEYCPDCGTDLDGDDYCENCGWEAAEKDPWEEDPDDDCEEDNDTCCCSCTESSYDVGYAEGQKDGRAKVKRQHYDGDELNQTNGQSDYIAGYNAGYKKARYNKE